MKNTVQDFPLNLPTPEIKSARLQCILTCRGPNRDRRNVGEITETNRKASRSL